MTESYSKSKLKRKKPSAEEFRSEVFSRGAKRSSLTSPSGDGGANTAGSAPTPAAARWWRTLQPPAVESLWAFTLKSALQNLENQLWDPVPGLPLPPAAKPSEPNRDEEWWGDLGCKVDPFPECSLLCVKTPPSPDPPSRASSQQDLPVQNKPGPNPPDRSPNHPTASPQLHQLREEAGSSRTTSRELTVSAPSLPPLHQQEVTVSAPSLPPLHQQEVTVSAPSLPPLHRQEVTVSAPSLPPLHRQEVTVSAPSLPPLHQQEVTVSAPSLPPLHQQEVTVSAQSLPPLHRQEVTVSAPSLPPLHRQEVTVSAPSLPADEEEQRAGRDEELQSCPMCLQAFPAGSTQMDRDGHLAQCLSEMNVDLTW